MNRFKNNLYIILDNMSLYKREKDIVLSLYIKNRLSESFNSYLSDINTSFNYLKFKDSLNVLKGFNKYGTNR